MLPSREHPTRDPHADAPGHTSTGPNYKSHLVTELVEVFGCQRMAALHLQAERAGLNAFAVRRAVTGS